MANDVTLSGNVTRNTTVISTSTGTPMAILHLAADPTEGRGRAAYVDVVSFGDLAAEAERIGYTGRAAVVEGSLRTRERENADGTKRYDLEVVAAAMHALDTRPPAPDGERP